jgi:hypothetical protein
MASSLRIWLKLGAVASVFAAMSRQLVYVRTERATATQLYRCERDGSIIMPPDGRPRRDDPERRSPLDPLDPQSR